MGLLHIPQAIGCPCIILWCAKCAEYLFNPPEYRPLKFDWRIDLVSWQREWLVLKACHSERTSDREPREVMETQLVLTHHPTTACRDIISAYSMLLSFACPCMASSMRDLC